MLIQPLLYLKLKSLKQAFVVLFLHKYLEEMISIKLLDVQHCIIIIMLPHTKIFFDGHINPDHSL